METTSPQVKEDRIMVVAMKITATAIRDAARREGLAQRRINDIFRQGGRMASQWWIDNCLEKHFTPQATALYNYRLRSSRWQAIKQRARIITDKVTGQTFHATQPPAPMVWTGRNRDYVLSRRGSYQAEATAKFARGAGEQKVSVIVKIPLAHAINPQNSGEITRLNKDELRKMRSIVFGYAKPKIRESIRRMLGARAR